MASFVVSELKQVGIEATLKQIETAQWHPMGTRGEFQIAANLTGIGPDDPDANFYENFACGSPRNYSIYCNEQVMAQSRSAVPGARSRRSAWPGPGESRRSSRSDVARPILDWRLDYFIVYPYVKNLIPHQSMYNFGRLQEVWLDK